MPVEILRAPDECFAKLADYPFAPHYVETDVVRFRARYPAEVPGREPPAHAAARHDARRPASARRPGRVAGDQEVRAAARHDL